MNSLKILVFMLSFAGIAMAKAANLTLDIIKKHYRDINAMQGEAEQTKTSPLLLRPLKSNVSLRFEKGLLTWQVEGQEAWQIRFDGDGKPVFLNGDKTLAQIPANAREKLDRTVGLVRNILTMDPGLERDFTLKLDQEFLTIVPKSESSGVFFQSIGIQFKPNADIQSISFKTQDDETKIVFKTIQIKRL